MWFVVRVFFSFVVYRALARILFINVGFFVCGDFLWEIIDLVFDGLFVYDLVWDLMGGGGVMYVCLETILLFFVVFAGFTSDVVWFCVVCVVSCGRLLFILVMFLFILMFIFIFIVGFSLMSVLEVVRGLRVGSLARIYVVVWIFL